MRCPICGVGDTFVSESRKWQGKVVRHRVCKSCRMDFYTEESVMEYRQGRRWKNLAVNDYKRKKKS